MTDTDHRPTGRYGNATAIRKIQRETMKAHKKKRDRMTRLAQFKPKPSNLPHIKENNMPDKKRKPAGLCAGRQTGNA